MRTIYKYPLDTVANAILTYEGARWLHVGNQNEHITVWAEVDTDQPRTTVLLWVVGTGQPIPDRAAEPIGTAIMAGGSLVFHIFTDAEETGDATS